MGTDRYFEEQFSLPRRLAEHQGKLIKIERKLRKLQRAQAGRSACRVELNALRAVHAACVRQLAVATRELDGLRKRAKPIPSDCPSLGPSNDSLPEVQVEIRAAELIRFRVLRVHDKFMTGGEMVGFKNMVDGLDPSTWLPGWILREYITCDNPVQSTWGFYWTASGIAPPVWSWDINRPLSAQRPEYAAPSRP